MNARIANLLLAGFVVVTLMLPLMAGSSASTPTQAQRSQSLAGGPVIRPGTIEAIVSEVDAWGGVTTAIGAMQNATHYGNAHVQDVSDVIVSQMENADGYVSMVVFTLNGLTPYPNGVVGPPIAVLQLTVLPVVIVPAVRAGVYMEDLSEVEAIALAEEVVAVYDDLLETSFERLALWVGEAYRSFSYGIPSVGLEGNSYQFTYVDLLTAATGEAAVADFRGVLAEMGGFMSLVGAPNWPDLLTTTFEMITVSHWMADYYGPESFMVMNMMSYTNVYIRADISHTDLVETKQNLVIAEASFTEPGVVQAVEGDEEYGLAEHLGYTSLVQNKMAEDPSCESISAVGGMAPGSLDIAGIPEDWMSFDDSYIINPGYEIDLPGYTLPENSTASDVIRAYLTYLPVAYAFEANEFIGDLDPTVLDDFVDFLWGGLGGPFPNMTEYIYSTNFTMIDTAVQEINIDLLAELMAGAGMTPTALTSRINETMLADEPVRAIVVAFFEYFDYYHVFELFDNSTYPDAEALEAYLNTFQDGVGQFLHDFAGIDAPVEFQDKEAIAAFMEEHWDIMLQALWNAMAENSTTDIKSAIHSILDPANLQEQVVPYMMADLGSSLLGGIGFFGAINLNESFALFGLSADDIVLTFEADPDSLSIEGPYVIITKTVADRTVNVGSAVNFEIMVKNYGSATAYDIKVLDGMSSGMDGEREFYWTHSSLAPGASWNITYSVTAAEQGLYSDFPAICVYFNVSLSSFDPDYPEDWHGTARYTTSARGYQILVSQPGTTGWFDGTILGIPTLYVVAGVGGIGVLAVAILLVRRR